MNTLQAGLSRYLSDQQLDRLGAASVGIVGAGGLGSNVAMMLVRTGVKRLTLVDHDIVEASNCNRQAYFPADIGTPKVLALSWHLQMLEPAVQLAVHQVRVTQENGAALFAGCPILVEAVDGAADKAMLYTLFASQKDLYVTASGLAGTELTPMEVKRPRKNVVAVGDFRTGIDSENPPLAPRVMQAASMQAGAVVSFILSE